MCSILTYSILFLANTVLVYTRVDYNFQQSNKYLNADVPKNYSYKELNDHTMVTDLGVFPYVVAILKKSTFISTGALVDENWVITAGDALFLLRESARVIRVRLGSINNKKGGVLLPIKLFEIHPYFSDTKPEFDIALIKLPRPVVFTLNLNPIRLQRRIRDITATHFIVTAWPSHTEKTSDELQRLHSMEVIQRRRILTVSHVHPTDRERCTEEKEALDINSNDTIMCLDLALGTEPCIRDAGAPVVLNGILWGIISSWKSEDCEIDPGPSFVTLVAANNISSWIRSTIKGHRWSPQSVQVVVDDDSEEYEDTDTD